jgi:N-methylhydantoinase A/oxoprolinase/acetone carboxylase beta subunit
MIETPINTSNDGDVATQLRRAYADGIRSISVLLLHSFIYPHHELAVEKLGDLPPRVRSMLQLHRQQYI